MLVTNSLSDSPRREIVIGSIFFTRTKGLGEQPSLGAGDSRLENALRIRGKLN